MLEPPIRIVSDAGLEDAKRVSHLVRVGSYANEDDRVWRLKSHETVISMVVWTRVILAGEGVCVCLCGGPGNLTTPHTHSDFMRHSIWFSTL